jgi:hypothetical protein
MKNKHTLNKKKRVAGKEGNQDIPEKQPKVRVQLMVPYHVLMNLEECRPNQMNVNMFMTNLIIIGLKHYQEVVK